MKFIPPHINDRIVLDVDGVLLDFLENFERVAELELGRKIKRTNNSFNLADCYQLTRAEANRVWDRFDDGGHHDDYEPMPGAVDGANLLQQMGYDIWLVTAVPSNVQQLRHTNLYNHSIHLDLDQIICVGMGGCKRDIIKEINPGMFVDDRLEYLDAASFVPCKVWIKNEIEQKQVSENLTYHTCSDLYEFALEVFRFLDQDLYIQNQA